MTVGFLLIFSVPSDRKSEFDMGGAVVDLAEGVHHMLQSCWLQQDAIGRLELGTPCQVCPTSSV